jgi:hypothetical protein
MSVGADVRDTRRDLIVRCVGEAYEMLDVIPGVDPNGPVLVWLAEQFRQIDMTRLESEHGG